MFSKNNSLKNRFFNSTIFFHEIIFLLLYRNVAWLSGTSKSEIAIDTLFTFFLRMVMVITKHSQLRFNKLSDIVVYDHITNTWRFLATYIFSNPDREFKLRIRFSVDSKTCIIASLSEIYYISSWAEREAMDLFGVKFLGHRDLRRILGDYGLWGFPGRKDFPLVGLYSYFYVVNFLRVFRVRGMLSDFWSIYFQKKIYTQC